MSFQSSSLTDSNFFTGFGGIEGVSFQSSSLTDSHFFTGLDGTLSFTALTAFEDLSSTNTESSLPSSSDTRFFSLSFPAISEMSIEIPVSGR